MTSEVIIDVQPKDISIALLEDKQLVEYQQEQRTSMSVPNVWPSCIILTWEINSTPTRSI